MVVPITVPPLLLLLSSALLGVVFGMEKVEATALGSTGRRTRREISGRPSRGLAAKLSPTDRAVGSAISMEDSAIRASRAEDSDEK
jgi:hypothetical protein